MLDVVAGFDAGGTSTKCALMTLEGEVVAYGEAGPGNFQLVGEAGLRTVLSEAFGRARAAAGGEVRVHAIWCGVAGASSGAERERIGAVCRELALAPLWRVTGDMVPALAAGTRAQPGIVVIAGTGSICWGCDASGQSARAGGWGYLLGDEGSGFAIGRSAAAAALRSFDGRGPKTSLLHRILHALGCADVHALVRCVYGADQPRTLIASLAPVVLEAAEDGDPVAMGILDEAAEALVQGVLAVHRALHFGGEVTVVASGGLLQRTDALLRRVRLLLAPRLPAARVVLPAVEPVVGACYLALRALRGEAWPPNE